MARRTNWNSDAIMRRVTITESGCWEWDSLLQRSGYGRVKVLGRAMVAHRFVYELLEGPIAPGLTLDHLCRNRACVNPAHLEQVTPRQNVLRGNTIVAVNAQKTHCIRGHALSGANLLPRRNGRRNCRQCARDHERENRNTPKYRAAHAAYERNRRQRRKELA